MHYIHTKAREVTYIDHQFEENSLKSLSFYPFKDFHKHSLTLLSIFIFDSKLKSCYFPFKNLLYFALVFTIFKCLFFKQVHFQHFPRYLRNSRRNFMFWARNLKNCFERNSIAQEQLLVVHLIFSLKFCLRVKFSLIFLWMNFFMKFSSFQNQVQKAFSIATELLNQFYQEASLEFT